MHYDAKYVAHIHNNNNIQLIIIKLVNLFILQKNNFKNEKIKRNIYTMSVVSGGMKLFRRSY